ncbi:antibiotic biosynthesis monooxygenase [Haloarcula marina]|uniref:antibiotic biosynthesis monooxygenase n=1 Tax=Haloarcula marina TaxID=2961574 RepID=UPI0020B87926|nr:antibiotic biosynthesis monooxygenase [Halomicroarcula marina]
MAYMHVKATVDDVDEWRADFEGYHSRRAEYGGQRYQLFQSTDSPNDIVVLIEFDEEANARAWNDYLVDEGELTDPQMRDVEISYLDLTDQKTLSPV